MPESALVVLVPTAETLVKPFRDRYDPSAAAGMPAHVTLLYPFKRRDESSDGLLNELRHHLARFAPFTFSLRDTRRFPGALYLAPEPAEPFRELTLAIWRWYPDTPPYSGKWPDVVPHLSVANVADERELDRVADDFAQASAAVLPINATATDVALMDNSSGCWQVRATFELAGG